MHIDSELSNPFCYENKFKGSFISSFSKLIGEEKIFKNSIGVTVTLNPVMGNDLGGIYILSLLPKNINGREIPEEVAIGYGYKYLKNNICVFYQSATLYGGCEIQTISTTRDQPLSFNVYFDQLKWNKPTIKDTFDLRFQNYLPKKDPPTTGSIQVTTVPTTIELISQPPSNILLGDIFQVVVLATLGDGSALPRATITANITQSVNVQNLDPTSIESMINLFGNQDMGINALSQLYREFRVTLDESRARVVTGIQGYAKMNLKITGGKSGYYALIFESGSTKSLPSSTFYLQNPIKEIIVTNNEDLKQEIEVDFEEKDNEYLPTYGALATLPIIQLTATKQEYIDRISYREEEFEIFVINKDSVEAAKIAIEELGQNTTNMTLYAISTYKNKKKPKTSEEEMKNLWDAISKGAQMVGKIAEDIYVDVQYDSPSETSTGVYEFTVIQYIYIYI